jgi:hypothetical protein
MRPTRIINEDIVIPLEAPVGWLPRLPGCVERTAGVAVPKFELEVIEV